MNIAHKAGLAGSLLFIRKTWGAIINIIVMAYLARTLNTSDFGVVAISGTFIVFIQTVGIAGISEYIIFYNGVDQKEKQNAAFWLNFFLTLVISIIILIGAPYWAAFYGDKRISDIIYLLLIGFFFTMFSSIPISIFRKNLDYKPMILVQTIFGTVSQLSQALFAFLGFGVYSLALPSAIVAPFLSITLLYKSGYVIQWKNWGILHWKNIYNYTRHIIGARILTKFANEGDTLLVGKFLGMEALGIYDIAFKLSNILNQNLVPIITNVSFPLFAKNTDNIPQLKIHFIKMTSLLAFIFFPLIGLMILTGPFLIQFLYGIKWLDAVLPFQILAIFAAFRTISSPSSGLFNALNKPQYGFYFSLVFTNLLLLSIWISASYGLITTCITVTSMRVVGGFFLVYYSCRLIKLNFISFYKNIIPAIAVSSIITLIGILLNIGIDSFIKCLAISFIFIIIYILILRILYNNSLKKVQGIIYALSPRIGSFLNRPFTK